MNYIISFIFKPIDCHLNIFDLVWRRFFLMCLLFENKYDPQNF